MTGSVRYGGEYLDRLGAHVYFGGLKSKVHGDDGHGHGFIDDKGNFTVFRDPYDPSVPRARRAATGEYTPAAKRRR